ncbi:MAG: hypothetical protein K2I04_00770, partial [Muribaculaceae bacterium]|nr:hypothetical protein [Muribaculaceae bacterium]
WDTLVRLNKERELVGMYLSAHPLDPYWLEVNHGVGTTCAEKNEIAQPTAGPIAFAGMVVGNEERKTGAGTMTIVKVEDYSGGTDFAIFEKQKAEFGHLCVPGSAVCVIGTFKQVVNRTTGVSNLRFGLDRIIPLDTLKGNLIDEITLRVEPTQVELLTELLDKPECTGDAGDSHDPQVPVSITVYSPDIGRKLTFTTALKMRLNRDIMKHLEELDIDFSLKRRQFN